MTASAGEGMVAPCPLAKKLHCIVVLVIDQADQPVANVLLALRAGGCETSSRTSSAGMVRFEGLEEGAYTLLAPAWDKSACMADGERALPAPRLPSGSPAPPWVAQTVDPGPASHVVEEGEGLTALAFRFGYAPQTLWEFSANADLVKGRRRMHVRPGDTLKLPKRDPAVVAAVTGRFYYLRIVTTPASLRLRFVYEDGQPRATEPYVALALLASGDTASLLEGELDSDGVLDALIALDVTELEVTVGTGRDQEVYRLQMGAYRPCDHARGVQSRLAALGYYMGELDDDAGPVTAEAIAAFQEDFSLPITGLADEATMAKLEHIFGS